MIGYSLKFVSPSLFLMDSDLPILSGRLQTMKRRYSALRVNFAVSITRVNLRRGAASHRVAD